MSESKLTSLLQSQFGFAAFREGQEAVIEHILAGDSTLAIFPTGSGKSLCYQFSAVQLPHLTLVVSPLLALMKDQLAFLQAQNIPAASLDSTLNYEQYRQVVIDVKANKLKVLMVSVERFKNERFRLLMEGVAISLMVVDEAHCISEWGHNFRPDYLKLPRYEKALNAPKTLLLTATATKRVKLDMAEKFNIGKNAIVQTGFYRQNLHLHVLSVTENLKNTELKKIIAGFNQGGGIVYVTLQHTAEQVAGYLKQQGVNASAYHAGMKYDQRERIQDEFMNGDTAWVVATIAFGMGVDKADIRCVVHYDLPKSMENYSQEIGRAGRDGQVANCFVLGNLNSLNTIENFVYGDTPEQAGIEVVVKHILKHQVQGQWEVSLYALSSQSNIRQLTLKTLLVQLEMQGVITPRYTYSAEYSVKLLRDQPAILASFEGERRHFVDCLLSNIQFKRTWGTVNFDAIYTAYPKGDRKRIITALEYFKEHGWIDLKPSGSLEVFSVDVPALDKGLAGRLAQHFKRHEQNEIQRIGLMLGFLQSASCLSYGLAQYFDDQNAPRQCGCCSVCKGQLVGFPEPKQHRLDADVVKEAAQALSAHLQAKGEQPPSRDLVTRFLVGINVPLFTRTKAKVVSGFGVAEAMRYGAVYDILGE